MQIYNNLFFFLSLIELNFELLKGAHSLIFLQTHADLIRLYAFLHFKLFFTLYILFTLFRFIVYFILFYFIVLLRTPLNIFVYF